MSTTSPAIPAGWYPVPGDPAQRIGYWDGTCWIGTPVPPPAAAGGAAILGGLVGGPTGRRFGGIGGGIGGGIAGGISSIVFGLIFALVSCFWFPIFFTPAGAAGEVSTTAVVVSVSYGSADDDGTTFCQPVVRFQGADRPLGMSVRTSPCPVSIGQRAKVLWVPGNPGSVRLDQSGFGIPQFIFAAFGIVGVIVAIGGVVQILKSIGLVSGGPAMLRFRLRRR